MICQNCGKNHNGLFGSGRFCSKSCAVSYSNKQRKLSLETRLKISKGVIRTIQNKQKNQKYCKLCGKLLNNTKRMYCCDEHRNICQHKIPTLIKYFNFNTCLLGTSKAIDEYNRIKQMLYNLYWNEHKSSTEIAKMFNYNSHVENLTNKVFKMLNIPKKLLNKQYKKII